MDILTIIGIIVGLVAIIGGNILEGGHTDSLMIFTAFFIVFGGTLGAVMVQTPMPIFLRSMKNRHGRLDHDSTKRTAKDNKEGSKDHQGVRVASLANIVPDNGYQADNNAYDCQDIHKFSTNLFLCAG